MFDFLKKLLKKENKEASKDEGNLIEAEKKVKIYSLNLIVDKEKVEHVQKVIEDIANKDSSFPKPIQQGYLIVLSGSEDLNDLHRKGMWLTKKVDGIIGYFIREVK